jgi:hypothetical protein
LHGVPDLRGAGGPKRFLLFGPHFYQKIVWVEMRTNPFFGTTPVHQTTFCQTMFCQMTFCQTTFCQMTILSNIVLSNFWSKCCFVKFWSNFVAQWKNVARKIVAQKMFQQQSSVVPQN